MDEAEQGQKEIRILTKSMDGMTGEHKGNEEQLARENKSKKSIDTVSTAAERTCRKANNYRKQAITLLIKVEEAGLGVHLNG